MKNYGKKNIYNRIYTDGMAEQFLYLSDALQKKDDYTFGHCERVSYFCSLLGTNLNLSVEKVKVLSLSATLHDIGKVVIPDEILNKQSALSHDEQQLMQEHAQMGADLIQTTEHFPNLMPAILYHHERHDGSGYPYGLRGREIPLFARIISVADAYDAMTSDRPYCKPISKQDALYDLVLNKDTQFDPVVVNSFVNTMRTNNSRVWHFPDNILSIRKLAGSKFIYEGA